MKHKKNLVLYSQSKKNQRKIIEKMNDKHEKQKQKKES